MQTDSLCSRTFSAIAAAALLASAGCGGYSVGPSDPAALNTYAYVGLENGLNQTFSVAQFQVSSDGTFTALNPPSVPIDLIDLYPNSLTVDPSGKYLFHQWHGK